MQPNRGSIFTGCTPHTTSASRLHKSSFEEFFGKRPPGQPFFLHVEFNDPHRPYADGAISKPHDSAQVMVPPTFPALPLSAKIWRTTMMRSHAWTPKCGRLFDILRRRNLDKNTIVVFTGDNGMPFPRAKGARYDPGLNVPLLAWWQGCIVPGSVMDDLIVHVDLPVTWLDAAGLAKPAKMQGRSFLNLAPGSGAYTAHTEICAERNWHGNFDPIRAVRTQRHKLIFNAAPHFPYRPPGTWRVHPLGSLTWKRRAKEL